MRSRSQRKRCEVRSTTGQNIHAKQGMVGDGAIPTIVS